MTAGTDRGITQVLSTDAANQLFALINQVASDLAAQLPYYGTASGNCDANGYASVTHHLGFKPDAVFAQNRANTPTTGAWMVPMVNQLTNTTFQIRCGVLKADSSDADEYNTKFVNGGPYDIFWVAFRNFPGFS